jgi:serine/threonine-protein kinase
MAGQVVGEMVGAVLGGRYVLRSFLGAGASAQVYLADDTHLRRRVAVKVLHPFLAADAAFLRRFTREAVAAAGLDHPHLLAVYDHFPGSATEPPYLVTPYMEGGSLRAVLDAGRRLTLSQACLIGMEAASGLAVAHGKGLVHRDVKPANLLFDAAGRLRIGDFGLARAIAEGAATEPVGAVVGTARYAAPEQAGGGSVDDRADVYALALVLVEVVTGSVPFARDTVIATLAARMGTSLEPPEAMGVLSEAIRRAGTIDPTQRASAAEVLDLLQRAARQLPRPTPLPAVVPARSDAAPDAVPEAATTAIAAGIVAPRAVPVPSDPSTDTPPSSSAQMVSAQMISAQTEIGHAAEPFDDTTLLAPTTKPPTPSAVRTEGPGAGPAGPVVPVPMPEADDRRSDRARWRGPAADDEPRRRRRWPWVLAALAIIGAGGAAGAYLVANRDTTTAVPAVVGMAESDATRTIAGAELEPVVSRAVDERVPVDLVIAQDPAAGTEVDAGSRVALRISLGPAPRLIPDLSGMDTAAATAALEAVQLRAGAATEAFDEDVADGIVVRWTPTGEVPRDSAVDLVVSAGPAPREVPNLSGMTPDQAREALPDGITGEVVEEFSERVPAGEVIAANYKPGSKVPRGTTVRIRVSKGPELIELPDVSGRSVARATTVLKDAGFDVVGVDGPPDGTVQRTDPPAGRSLRKGTDVRLVTG